ncbi:hypothetical protein IQ16_07756 [Bradyrhizobium huanghuaihaiense]|uniref:Uncharacterized protein n=1 Tax=Bradyrhizobium huanghuaihaiense TaxID=990078 RepID=A0A562QTW1_9BRAD|nr:hypothetical protein IQ16_07756 [Bradyrhizobium huanghuaihaiense]
MQDRADQHGRATDAVGQDPPATSLQGQTVAPSKIHLIGRYLPRMSAGEQLGSLLSASIAGITRELLTSHRNVLFRLLRTLGRGASFMVVLNRIVLALDRMNVIAAVNDGANKGPSLSPHSATLSEP